MTPTASPVYECPIEEPNRPAVPAPNRVRVADLGDEVGVFWGFSNEEGESPWQVTKAEARSLFLALAQMFARSAT